MAAVVTVGWGVMCNEFPLVLSLKLLRHSVLIGISSTKLLNNRDRKTLGSEIGVRRYSS